MNRTVLNFKQTIFSTMTELANKHQAINLSQGFPDFKGPLWAIEMARESFSLSDHSIHQYAPSHGLKDLRRELSLFYKAQYDLSYSPETEITVTDGCTEAIFCSALGLLNPGDEVLVFEPTYDSYLASIQLAGARAKVITLNSPDWTFSEEELLAQVGPSTRMIFLNTPHNPTGKVFSKKEMEFIAKVAIDNDLYVLSDEVYEFFTFDNKKHIPMASLPGMKERTLTLSSLGKTLSVTGWKIGWACAPEKITKALRHVKQFTTFSTNHPLQLAAARALKEVPSYIPELRQQLLQKRDQFIEGLKETSLRATPPNGSYFICAHIPDEDPDDEVFCREMIEKAGVAAIPPSAFYTKSDEGKRLVRFCFAKKNDTLVQSLERLKMWRPA